jgi:hypothetical protein
MRIDEVKPALGSGRNPGTGQHGLLEITAGLLMCSPQAASAALIAVGIMFGGIIAHGTVLSLDVGDSGRHVAMLALVLVSSLLVSYARRRDLPIIGKSLGAGFEMTTREQHEDNATFINEYLAAKCQ